MKVMLETPHVVVGAAIASKIGNPLLAIPLALGSHFLLEQVPHWNPHLNTEIKKFGKVTSASTRIVVADACLALTLGSYLAFQKLPDVPSTAVVLLACLASILPDLIEAPYFFLRFRNPLLLKWIAFQKKLQSDADIIPGLLTQIIVVLAALWWVL